MRLMRYSYTVTYVPGKELVAADALSRNPLRYAGPSTLEQQLHGYVNLLEKTLPVTSTSLKAIATEQTKDRTCQTLVRFSTQGWPSRRDLNPELKHFLEYRDAIAFENSLLMYKGRIFVPISYQKYILQQIHLGHQGIVKCKARARDSVWWPGIGQDIGTFVSSCPACKEHALNRKEPCLTTKFPRRPWQKVAMDLFFIKGRWWLVVTDYYSRFPEIAPLRSTSSETVIEHCKSSFARHGIPDEVISDNGPQFSGAQSSAFKNFAATYKFRHTTSSPRYPQSNGLAEAAVKIIKNSLKKTDDPYESLLAYRTSPLANGYSPSELLMGRKLSTTIPISPEALLPKTPNYDDLRKREELLKFKQATWYNTRHGVRHLPRVQVGDRVSIIDLKRQGVVKSKATTPRSFWVATRGKEVRRTRTHLYRIRKTPLTVTMPSP
ncbi:uncharacterized protein K02A2.6-like [Ornithodoros turicata]|uniref:uncharacterized protein K02A2.6-like n=1 Tax=Ornithodoros turicata TaxID=34597 RepID=UPI003139C33E